MKKYLFMAAAALLTLTTGCEDFLDTESYTKKNSGNFPTSAEDASNMVTGVYATLNLVSTDYSSSNFFVSELASDDRFGGGGANDRHFTGLGHLMNYATDALRPCWIDYYRGVYRANYALETLDQCAAELSESQLNSYKGEVHFLRAYFFNEMAELWGSVPLTLSTESENLPKADPALIYGQIAYDLQQAINLLPATPYNQTSSGRVTKWAAEAMMARVFLFYTGFYQSADLPLGDGAGANSGSISKDQVISWIDDCVNNSGHSLVDDFRLLWPYSNQYTASHYDYVKDLYDAGRYWYADGENPEQVWNIKMSSMSSWDGFPNGAVGYSNQWCLAFGVRSPGNGEDNTYPWGKGWGAGPVAPNLWNDWKEAEPLDPRREASIADFSVEYPDYVQGADRQMEDSNFWQKKVVATQAYDEQGNRKNVFGSVMYGRTDDDMALGHVQDLCVIRFADVLLMQSELKGDATGMNLVRARVGLPPVGYSLQALQQERRFELAFEGRRWADIRRWHIAEDCLERQIGTPIYNQSIPTKMKEFGSGYRSRYQETNGFFKIPESEIDLSSGVLEQNAGWTGTDSNFPGW